MASSPLTRCCALHNTPYSNGYSLSHNKLFNTDVPRCTYLPLFFILDTIKYLTIIISIDLYVLTVTNFPVCHSCLKTRKRGKVLTFVYRGIWAKAMLAGVGWLVSTVIGDEVIDRQLNREVVRWQLGVQQWFVEKLWCAGPPYCVAAPHQNIRVAKVG